jgi:hypothetical protein
MRSTWHILFLGIAFFQMFFMLGQWLLFRRREYLFYIAYVFFACTYILFRVHEAIGMLNIKLPLWLNELTDTPLVILSYFMYLQFTRQFLTLKVLQPKVYKLSKIVEIIFVVFIIVRTMLIPFKIGYTASSRLFTGTALLLLLFIVPMVILMLRQKNTLNNFLVLGSVCFIGGGACGMTASNLLPKLGENNDAIMLGIEIGILAELLLLNTGFVFKNRILQLQVIEGQKKIMHQLLKDKKEKHAE